MLVGRSVQNDTTAFVKSSFYSEHSYKRQIQKEYNFFSSDDRTIIPEETFTVVFFHTSHRMHISPLQTTSFQKVLYHFYKTLFVNQSNSVFIINLL